MARKNQPTIIKFLSRPRFWVVLIASVTILLRLPSLFEPHRYADEEIYLTLGLGLRQGLVFYRDLHDNKPPLLYLTAALAGTLFWFRFILLIWHGINIWAFWKLADAVVKQAKVWFIGVLSLFFAIITALPLTEGNIANGENFMIMPATWGAYLLWKYRDKKNLKIFTLAGLLFAVGFLFKIPIGFDLAGITLFLILLNASTLKDRFDLVMSPAFWGLIGGFLTPILSSIGYYSLKGAFAPYVKAALFQNISYLSSWGNSNTANQPLLQNDLVQRGLILLTLVTGLYFLRKKLSKKTLFGLFWFIFALFGALLSSRPYPHYLLEPIVPVILLLGLCLTQKLKDKLTIILIVTLLPLSLWYYQFWHYQTLPYYRNFISFALGHKTKQEYFSYFEGVNRNYQIAKYVLDHTLPKDKIFVWGTEPAIYALSQRLPVGRYTVSYHIADFNAWEETINALETDPPPLVVFFTNENKKFLPLEAFLANQYTPAKTIEKAIIYQRLY